MEENFGALPRVSTWKLMRVEELKQNKIDIVMRDIFLARFWSDNWIFEKEKI